MLLKFLNKASCNFVSIGNVATSKLVTVKWFTCYLQIKAGGLKIKDLVSFKKVFLSKLAWKLISNYSFVFCFLQAQYWSKFNYYIWFSI